MQARPEDCRHRAFSAWAQKVLWLLGIALGPVCHAQITTDGSLGAARTLTGPNFAIDAALGRQIGGNLFHSFGAFNLLRNESAVFSGPSSAQNILARVTGGSASSIDGLLRSDIPGATLFLLNPAGVIFGPNASIDVQGSFHVSSANYLRLSDGARFMANTGSAGLLTAAPPTAFGFVDPAPARITFNGSTLAVRTGATMSVIGGELTAGQASPTSTLGTQLSAPGGSLLLVAVGSPGEVVAGSPNFGTGAFSSLAPVNLLPGTLLSTNAGDAGTIGVLGSRITIDGAAILARTTGTGRSGSITVAARDSLNIGGTGVAGDGTPFASTLNASTRNSDGGAIRLSADRIGMSDHASVRTSADGSGRAGELRIEARDVAMAGGAIVESVSQSPANAAPLSLQLAGSLTMTEAAQIRSGTAGAGRGADVVINANRISLTDRETAIWTLTSNSGKAGNLALTSAAQMTLTNEAGIASASTGTGDAATISIQTPRLALNGAFINGETRVGGTGRAAQIDIAVGDLDLASSSISASTGTAGSAGAVNIDARGSVSADNSKIAALTQTGAGGGGIHLHAAALTLDNRSVIDVSTLGNGAAGNASIIADRIEIRNGSWINARSGTENTNGSVTAGTGNSGSVDIAASQSLRISGTNSAINTISYGDGAAGPVSIRAGTMLMEGGAQIATSTAGGQRTGAIDLSVEALTLTGGSTILSDNGVVLQGAGVVAIGNGALASMNINATGAITLSGVDTLVSSRNVGAGGAAGDLSLRGASLDIAAGALISTRNFSSGSGSNIRVDVDRLVTSSLNPAMSAISASAFGSGQAGNITIIARQSADVRGNIASTSSRAGSAGDISISTPQITVTGAVVSSSTVGDGNAGTIRIDANQVRLVDGGQLANSTGFEDPTSGNVQVGRGSAAQITITARESVLISGRGSLSIPSAVLSQTLGTGNAGSITINSPQVEIVSGGQVSAATTSDGSAGSVALNVGSLRVIDGAQINSASGLFSHGTSRQGSGAGGDLTINASGSVLFSGSPTAVATTSLGAGRGGNIAIDALQLQVSDGALILAASRGSGDAGNIRISVRDSIVLSGAAAISTSSLNADGGNITIFAPHSVYLKASGIAAAVRQGGNGGNITIDPDLVILTDASRISADAQRGNGGNITITITNSGAVIQSLDSSITASSALGVNGTVQIKAPDSDILGRITRLPAVIVDASALLAERCAARAASTQQSSFIVSGRGGLPAGTSDGLMASMLDLETDTGASARAAKPPMTSSARPGIARTGPMLAPIPMLTQIPMLAQIDCSGR